VNGLNRRQKATTSSNLNATRPQLGMLHGIVQINQAWERW
jgi:hypothetical protein